MPIPAFVRNAARSRFFLPGVAIGLALGLGIGVAISAGSQKAERPVTPVPRIALQAGAVIAAQGDSLTYGEDNLSPGLPPINGASSTRSVSPYPEYLASRLIGLATVENHGVPGAESTDGVRRWPHRGEALTIILYGTNDLIKGQRGTSGTSVATYRENIRTMILAKGRRVLVLTPPPLKDPKLDALLQDYRDAAIDVARQEGVPALDTVPIVHGVAKPWTDGVHLTPEAYRAVALGVLACLDFPPET